MVFPSYKYCRAVRKLGGMVGFPREARFIFKEVIEAAVGIQSLAEWASALTPAKKPFNTYTFVASHHPSTDLCPYPSAYNCLLPNFCGKYLHTLGVFKVDWGTWLCGGVTIEIHRRCLYEWISRLIRQLIVKHSKEERNYDVLL
jgi:hypothetical protein